MFRVTSDKVFGVSWPTWTIAVTGGSGVIIVVLLFAAVGCLKHYIDKRTRNHSREKFHTFLPVSTVNRDSRSYKGTVDPHIGDVISDCVSFPPLPVPSCNMVDKDDDRKFQIYAYIADPSRKDGETETDMYETVTDSGPKSHRNFADNFAPPASHDVEYLVPNTGPIEQYETNELVEESKRLVFPEVGDSKNPDEEPLSHSYMSPNECDISSVAMGLSKVNIDEEVYLTPHVDIQGEFKEEVSESTSGVTEVFNGSSYLNDHSQTNVPIAITSSRKK